MFDVGFSELILVALVALVVIGPERLPKAARVAGMWLGRARRTLASVKDEIDRELKAEELKEILNKQAQGDALERILEVPRPAARAAAPPADPAPPAAGTAPSRPDADPRA
jgi:sec-independent protein translocase protein TatB